ncbi:MAG: hypothetical protein HRT89_02015 [Lentisphaeria bacterium]|nr:hypothetical protein [Lentisphaeria bacterium]
MSRLSFEEFISGLSSVQEKSRSLYIHWASKFINYSHHDLSKMTTETETAFINEQRKNSVPEWQLRQAGHAIHLYIRVYVPLVIGVALDRSFSNWNDVFDKGMDDFSYTTDTTYIHWIKHFNNPHF